MTAELNVPARAGAGTASIPTAAMAVTATSTPTRRIPAIESTVATPVPALSL
ncbi:hypothetical protein GCM10010403_16560 [Glycomyces rutgersensis]|uniref:Uncharacterized protein n=1 Tax=Glycomyces rutgersensis TaxID=58115 RepID=A0ABN3FC89_9ACTN